MFRFDAERKGRRAGDVLIESTTTLDEESSDGVKHLAVLPNTLIVERSRVVSTSLRLSTHEGDMHSLYANQSRPKEKRQGDEKRIGMEEGNEGR
jgi:hypothetical protein